MTGVSFEHRRADDNERVGTIVMTSDGLFAPFDLLGRPTGSPGALEAAEAALDEIGLSYLARPWRLLTDDGHELVHIVEVHPDHVVVAPELACENVAKATDLTRREAVPIPTDRLVEA